MAGNFEIEIRMPYAHTALAFVNEEGKVCRAPREDGRAVEKGIIGE